MKPVLDQGKPSRDRSKAKDPNQSISPAQMEERRKKGLLLLTTMMESGMWA